MPGRGRAKFTARLDAATGEALAAFARANGTTATALLEAFARRVATRVVENGTANADEWDDSPPAEFYRHLIGEARAIDEARRSRR